MERSIELISAVPYLRATDASILELSLELYNELVDNARDNLRRQRCELNCLVQPVAEFRREHPLDRLFVLADADFALKADGRLGKLHGTRIGGHDQDHTAKIHALAIMVGKLAIIHYL